MGAREGSAIRILPEITAVMPRPDLDTWVGASEDKNERESSGILDGDV